ETWPVDVRYSDWDCTLEHDRKGEYGIRLGLRMIRGIREDDAHRLVASRQRQGLTSVEELALCSQLNRRAMELLADARAPRGLARHPHAAGWADTWVQEPRPLFAEAPTQAEQGVALPLTSVGENLMADYALVGTTMGPHPLRLLRNQLKARCCRSSR